MDNKGLEKKSGLNLPSGILAVIFAFVYLVIIFVNLTNKYDTFSAINVVSLALSGIRVLVVAMLGFAFLKGKISHSFTCLFIFLAVVRFSMVIVSLVASPEIDAQAGSTLALNLITGVVPAIFAAAIAAEAVNHYSEKPEGIRKAWIVPGTICLVGFGLLMVASYIQSVEEVKNRILSSDFRPEDFQSTSDIYSVFLGLLSILLSVAIVAFWIIAMRWIVYPTKKTKNTVYQGNTDYSGFVPNQSYYPPQGYVPPQGATRFDPNTGVPIGGPMRFDPNTGAPIVGQIRFDPMTGQPIYPTKNQPPVPDVTPQTSENGENGQ